MTCPRSRGDFEAEPMAPGSPRGPFRHTNPLSAEAWLPLAYDLGNEAVPWSPCGRGELISGCGSTDTGLAGGDAAERSGGEGFHWPRTQCAPSADKTETGSQPAGVGEARGHSVHGCSGLRLPSPRPSSPGSGWEHRPLHA